VARRIFTRVRNLRNEERGAALVEFTFIAVLLFTILFGIVEFGLAFRDRLTVANATQTAARVGSALGDDLRADFEVLKSLEQSLQTLPNSGIGVVRYVDIFEADGVGEPKSSCPGGDCNRYIYFPNFTATCDWSPCPDPATGGALGGGWAADDVDRDVVLPNLDVMGVRVTFAHDWVTGGLVPLPNVDCDGTPGAGCWEDVAIMRLEPQRFGS
jgi:Flp pilus assembly pilin Flp